MAERHTDVFLAFWILAAVAWDVTYLTTYGSSATISGRLLYWCQAWPPFGYLVVLAVGVLVGHWFLPQRGP